MRLLNKTKESVVAEDPMVMDSFFSRLRGLMFRMKFPKAMLFVFPNTSSQRNSIHSFFVFFEFDAVYLDDQKRVIDIYSRVKPFTPYIEPKKPTKYLLELEAGSVSKLGISLGDEIEF